MATRATVSTTEATPRVIDVQALIDAAPVSSLQKRLLFLCFLVIAIDGSMLRPPSNWISSAIASPDSFCCS
jgi:hypothetical protein